MKNLICRCDTKPYCKGLCRNCYERQLKQLNPEFYKRQLKNSSKWRKGNVGFKIIYDAFYRLMFPPKADQRFFNHIKQKFNLTREDYENLVNKSNNTCYICGRKPYEGKKLHLDHDHKTGIVRGLLCARCNWYLATIENNPKILEIIKNYLKW